jgi:signal transduction histidine kinase
MKAPGDAAMELPWLPPSATALAALTRPQSASLWAQVRHDPGCVLLLAQVHGDSTAPFNDTLNCLSLLETALQFLSNSATPMIDWRLPEAARVAAIAQRQAWLAAELAARVPGCCPQRAWMGGLLAPLGWLALAALDSPHSASAFNSTELHQDAARWQRERWGMDHVAIARRLARLWRLPTWLTALLGHLGLHVHIAERLGAEPKLFQVVQLAIAQVQERDKTLALPIGASIEELSAYLGLPASELDMLADRAAQMPVQLPAGDSAWTPALLADLLRMAVEQRRQQEIMARLQRDLDQLQQALEQQCHEESERLHASKLAALAELAAGAGHEINNPLAVISGQAQYLLKQLVLAEEQLVEDPSPTLYLDSLKAKLHKALTTIVGQTQRIHHVLTDLMQFARPTPPRQQPIGLATLVREAVASLQATAESKKIIVHHAEAPSELIVRGDAVQWRTALVNVLRNAVEAAPNEGWVRIGCERDGADWVEIGIEDNGPGPAAALREHLFDPFFSGRSAGRGRGLGLSAAWRLAQQNGGDVRFDVADRDATRFILRLPVEQESVVRINGAANGNGHLTDFTKPVEPHPVAHCTTPAA